MNFKSSLSVSKIRNSRRTNTLSKISLDVEASLRLDVSPFRGFFDFQQDPEEEEGKNAGLFSVPWGLSAE